MRKIAKGIKGITVEIGGNTEPLDKALGGVNKKSRELQSELKQVERLLKLDPKSTELLAQKQTLLKQAINNTGEKLEALKEAEKQAQEQFQRGEISQEQYRSLQREIIRTEQELSRLSNEANQFESTITNSLKTASKNIGKFGDKVTDVGKKMLPLSAGITAIGVASIASFNDVDEGLDTVKTATGATGEVLADLEQQFNDVAGSIEATGFEFGAIGGALGEVNTRFAFTGDELEECTQQFLKFARANGIDATQAVQLVSRAMGDAGIDASEYEGVLDSLTVAAQASGIGIDKLTENVTKYGAPMRALGYDTKESIAIFASWEKAGVNTEIAFGGMKAAIGKWGKEGKDARKEFSKTLKKIEEAPDIAKATALAIDIFGQKAGPDLADAIQGGRFEFEEMIELLESSDGVLNTTYDGLIDGTDKAEQSQKNMKLALAQLGDVIMTTLSPIIDSATDAIKRLSEWFSKLEQPIQELIVKIGIILSVAAPLLIVIGNLISGFGKIIGVLAKLGPVITKVIGLIKGLFALMMANPIVAIVAGIIAVLTTLLITNEDFRNKVIEIWNSICSFFTETLPQVWQSVLDFFGQAPQFFTDLWTRVTDTFTQWGENITNFFTSTIPGWIESIGAWFGELPGRIGEGLGICIGTVASWVVNTWNYFVTNVPLWIESIGTWFSELPGKIGTWLEETIQRAITWGSEMAQKATETGQLFITNVSNFFTQLPGKVSSWLEQTIQEAIKFVTDMGKKGTESAKQFGDNISNGLKSLPSKMASIGKSIVEGLWNGITGMGSWLLDQVTSFANGVVSGFKKAFKINSPSKVMIEIGKFIDEGLAEGIADNADKVKEATKKVTAMIDEEIENVKKQRDADVSSLEKSLKGMDKAKQESVKEQIKLRKKQADEEIKELKKIASMSKEQLKEELDARKEFAKQVDDLHKALTDAIKEKYKQEYEAQEYSIKAQIDALDRWKEESIDRINSVYDAKINAIDEEMKALDKAEKEKDRQEAEDDDLDKINKLQSAIEFEHDETNKAQLQKELDKAIEERNKRLEKQELEDKKEELKNRKEGLEEKRKAEIDNINQIYKNEKEMYDIRLEEAKTFYDNRTQEAKLQAEAEKMIQDKNQKEIVELLNSYAPQYQLAGQTLGEKLAEGIQPSINEIKSMIASVWDSINAARQAASSIQVPSTSRSIADVNNSRTNHYNVNINGSSNIYNDMESTLRKMAFKIG